MRSGSEPATQNVNASSYVGHVNYREIIRRYTSSTLTMGTHGVRRIIFGLLPATARNIMCGSP